MNLCEFRAKHKQIPKTGAGEVAQHVRADPSAVHYPHWEAVTPAIGASHL